MPISDRWGAMAMALRSSCVFDSGGFRCFPAVFLYCRLYCLPVGAVTPSPSPAERCVTNASRSSALEGARVASPQHIVVGPPPRHEMLCHYSTVVTSLSTTCLHHSCRSRAARECLRGGPPKGGAPTTDSRETVSVGGPWPGLSSPSMR